MPRWLCALAIALAVSIDGGGAQVPAQLVPAPLVPAPLAPPPKGTGGIIVGQVIDAASGRGVPHAMVRLEARNRIQTRVADDRGRFFFKNLVPGELLLTAGKRGFLEGQYGRARAGGEGTPLVIYENQWITNLQLPVFRPATISGFVVDDGNEPVIGVKVQAFRRQFDSGRWRYVASQVETTDDEGAYRISDLVPGEYIVTVPSADAAVPVSVFEAIASTGSVTAEMSALVNLNGPFTIGLDGLPRNVVFDADGRTMRLVGGSATPPPSENGRPFAYPTTFHPGSDTLGQALPIAVAAGEVKNGVTFQLRPSSTARVTGFIIGPGGPVPNQLVRLVPEGAEELGLDLDAAATMTNDAGAFTFPSVPQGHYTLVARSAINTPRADGAVTALVDSTPSAAEMRWARQSVSVGMDDLANVIMTVRNGVTLNGRAYGDADRVPTPEQVARISVGVQSIDGRSLGMPDARVGPTGEFAIAGLPDGRYLVRVAALPDGWYLKSAIVNGVDVSETPLAIEPGGELGPLAVTITSRSTSIIGTVRDARGMAVGAATVVVFPATYKVRNDSVISPRRLREARAGAYGVYRLAGLPPGDYLFAAIDETAAANWQAPESLDRLAASAVRVTLGDVESRTIDVRIRR